MRDFAHVADFLVPRRKQAHLAILLLSLLMLPGISATFSPIDIESYDLESPELDANEVLREEFSSAGNIWAFGVYIRDSGQFGEPDSDVSMIADYTGEGQGVVEPEGGILNLTVLREIDAKAEYLRQHEISEFYLSFASQITGEPAVGIIDLAMDFRAFMSGQSALTSLRIDPETLTMAPPSTNWTDCGVLECLSFDDENLTQAHIDLAAHRLANHSAGDFLRLLSNDRAFTPDPSSPVIGPYGHQLFEDGTITSEQWGPGRWSASAAWMLVNFDREAMQSNGWTFSWLNASSDFGYEWDGVTLETKPVHNSVEHCRESALAGEAPCAVEWLYLALEEDLRATDDMVVTLMLAEGVNVEVNRELLSSAYLIAIMAVVVTILLWLSLRRASDVAIVAVGLVLSLLWMQGLIGWAIILGQRYGMEVIFRSQFSNLLPILVLALGIDDSLHALHRYKEERREGASPEQAVHTSISRVGRAILLTSTTTIVAFMANMTSNIAALRSFGIEAGLGVLSAFILTGLWVPLVRYDFDLWMESRGKLQEEKEGLVHMVPQSWLAGVTTTSARHAPVVAALTILITAMAVPMMFSLEGDFQVEDFIESESDLALGIGLINERFSDEGEPGFILVEGDIANPKVIAAFGEFRSNVNSHGPEDSDQISRLPTGEVEMIAIDGILGFAKAAMAWNNTSFVEAGWNPSAEDGGVGCDKDVLGLPSLDDRQCLIFLFGFVLTRGVPESGGYPPLPPSIVAEYIHAAEELDYERPWLTVSGEVPHYPRASMRYGISSPEQFALVEPALAQLEQDMAPLQELARNPLRERGKISSADEEYPITWAIPTGEPVIRFVAANSMQEEMQGTLLLGVVFCTITLWWGFREETSVSQRWQEGMQDRADFTRRVGSTVVVSGVITYFLLGTGYALAFATLALVLSILWGTMPFFIAAVTTGPIFVVIVWLYALIALAGYGLNMITVAIAAMSLGVGIDYVIHLIERYREEREKGTTPHLSLAAVGSASGLALFGSAVSDIAGFLVINQSKMGFFSTFGLFCAIMIGLSLIASMVLTPAVLGLLHRKSLVSEYS
ncbi:MMPL family transporter [Candidatus Thalassarchaeum betae]|uniref:efflux RND transporter permease subunit n=1 Tax=Candidatus Thalassarchaeum betae TaxID=2599289 RepID=UPI0030C6DD18|nr:MMPL family transporter [Candidatus Thalassoarchaea betae]